MLFNPINDIARNRIESPKIGYGNFLVEASTHVVEVCAYKLKPYNCGTSNRYMEQMHYEGILEVQVFPRKPVEHYFSKHV